MTLRLYPVVLELVRALAPYLPCCGRARPRLAISSNVRSSPFRSRGRNRQARYQSAAASAREALACFETAHALGWVEPLPEDLAALFHRVIGTLVRLIEPKRCAQKAPGRFRPSSALPCACAI
jgi:hypothetical protein